MYRLVCTNRDSVSHQRNSIKIWHKLYRTIYFRRKLQQMKNANYGAPIALSGAAVWRLVQSVARCIRAGSTTLAR